MCRNHAYYRNEQVAQCVCVYWMYADIGTVLVMDTFSSNMCLKTSEFKRFYYMKDVDFKKFLEF